MTSSKPQKIREPMWPSLATLAAVLALHMALPDKLAVFGHRWILALVVAALAVLLEIFHSRGMHKYCRVTSYAVLIAITLTMVLLVLRLIQAIVTREVAPDQLLVSAGILWITNIVVFAVWYWRLDAGGPHQRGLRESHTDGAFLFPQMVPSSADGSDDYTKWRPNFIDYLFLAFNTSTALSPTDSPVLFRWAKVLMMIQALISLTIVVLLAARAVNIL